VLHGGVPLKQWEQWCDGHGSTLDQRAGRDRSNPGSSEDLTLTPDAFVPGPPSTYLVTYPANLQFTVNVGDTTAVARKRSAQLIDGIRGNERLVSVSCRTHA